MSKVAKRLVERDWVQFKACECDNCKKAGVSGFYERKGRIVANNGMTLKKNS